jgi:hypothetical protein
MPERMSCLTWRSRGGRKGYRKAHETLWSAPVQRMVRSIQRQAGETEMIHEVDHVCGAAQNDEVHILKIIFKRCHSRCGFARYPKWR